MADTSVNNIDEVLRAMRAERAEVERKAKTRDEEYKRATKLYIKALHKETEAFERNAPNYDRRNKAFREEVTDIMERFKVGAFGLLKSRDRLHKEVESLNSYLLEHYPKLAAQVKENLIKEKEAIETRLHKVKEQNEKSGLAEFQLQMPTVNVVDIRAKRQELDRELGSQNSTYLGGFSKGLLHLDRYLSNPVGRTVSPLQNYNYLDEFTQKPNTNDPIQIKQAIKVQTRSLTPSRPLERGRDYSTDLVNRPNTDFLSEFMYRIPQVNLSPSKNEQRKATPTKSESLLYSPFTGGADTDSRFSRPSSMKKGQNIYNI